MKKRGEIIETSLLIVNLACLTLAFTINAIKWRKNSKALEEMTKTVGAIGVVIAFDPGLSQAIAPKSELSRKALQVLRQKKDLLMRDEPDPAA